LPRLAALFFAGRESAATSMAEATVDFAALTARLEAAPFQNRTAIELFSRL